LSFYLQLLFELVASIVIIFIVIALLLFEFS
jgi:hypothetical protein